MIFAALLGHAAIAAGLLAVGIAVGPGERVARAAATAGALLGLATVVARDSIGGWRGLDAEPGAVALAAGAVALAWMGVLGLDLGSARWRAGVLTGAGGSALMLFAAAQWFVPALLFWVCCSLALLGLAGRSERATGVWVAVALGDAAVVAALAAIWRDTGAWALPDAAAGWPVAALLGAVIVRSGAVPGAGVWHALDSPGACAIPLAVGSSLVLLSRSGGGREVWVGVGLLVLGLAVAGREIARRTLSAGLMASWPVCVMLAAIFAFPNVAPVAGTAALLGASAVMLWPDAIGRGRLSRGIVLSCLPPTIAFSAIVPAAAEALARMETESSTAASLPWIGMAALLPVALAGGVVIAALVARTEPSDDYEPHAVLATWLVAAAAIVTTLVFGVGADLARLPLARGDLVLMGAAVAAGGIVARRARGSTNGAGVARGSGGFRVGTIPMPRRAALAGAWFAAAAEVSAVAGVVGMTVAGLRVGFL